MRIALSLGFVLICGSLSPLAQQKDPPLPPGVHLSDSVRAALCPLQMDVRQGVGGNMMAVDKNGKQVEMFAQRLTLLLNDVRREHQTDAHVIEAILTLIAPALGWR